MTASVVPIHRPRTLEEEMNDQPDLFKIDGKAPGSVVQRIEPEEGTQNARLLEHLRQSGSTIDPMEAWRLLGIYRLSARVFDLKAMGHDIVSTRKIVLNRFEEEINVASYSLKEARQS